MIALAAAGCVDESAPPDDPSAPPLPPPQVVCEGLSCPPCASGDQCAPGDAGAYLDGTCCAAGDNLVAVGAGVGHEVVDLEADDDLVVLCGGFGASISDVSDPANPRFIATAGRRCQRAAFGPALDGGRRVVYLAHHGDSWVPAPSLSTYVVSGDRTEVIVADSIVDASILFEGLAYHPDGYLYVATHDGGLRVYRIAGDGVPIPEATRLDGFDNAWKVAVRGDRAYVADASAGVKVVSLADRTRPEIVQALPTTGLARDVVVRGDRVYVALGGSGVDVFDIGSTGQLEPRANIDTFGSAQAVDADDRLLAVANWDNVSVYDAATLQLLGTEDLRGYPDFEQDLAVALRGDRILVGEWEGLHVLEYRQGRVGADVWIEDELYQFTPDEVGARAVVVRNRGPLELRVSAIMTTDDAFSVDAAALTIEPGGADVFEVVYRPSAASGVNVLSLRTNDPDDGQANLEIPLLTVDTDEIDVGDRLTDDFAFLDPTGSGQLSNLEGKVIVLAYFALF